MRRGRRRMGAMLPQGSETDGSGSKCHRMGSSLTRSLASYV